MRILGIETSCDETAVAIVEDGYRVLSSVVSSQIAKHAVFGGVVPEVAAREHLKAIDPLTSAALHEAGLTLDQIDAVAVTAGPGLIGALLVGVSYGRALALGLQKPLIPVDHVRAHIHGALLGVETEPVNCDSIQNQQLKAGTSEDQGGIYPGLGLVVSGGHSNLYRMKSPTDFELLGQTIDDACGECFDKIGKLLGLPYPGGPQIEKRAKVGDPRAFAMPKMMDDRRRLVFSYSGLKTHTARLIRQFGDSPTDQTIADLCASFQEAALEQLVRKLRQGFELYPDSRSVLVAGGVAANERFRLMLTGALASSALQSEPTILFPAPAYCSDNAAMIAAYGFHLHQATGVAKSKPWQAYSRYGADLEAEATAM